jgi:hypothetical protein
MSASNSRLARSPSTVAQELQMNAALRGRIDPIYRELSDHWSSILQKLYPVWVLIAPGIANPAHLQLRSATVMLDSDRLLGTRTELIEGRLERDRILGTFGAGTHEVFHGKHTKVWVFEDNDAIAKTDPILAADRLLLEEPRMEAHGIRDFPPQSRRGLFLKAAIQAAVAQHILPALAEQMMRELAFTGKVTRELCGRSIVYLRARSLIGTVTTDTLAALEPAWQQVLGPQDITALDDVFARLVWCPDGDSERLSVFATEYREIIGPPDPEQDGEGDGGQDEAQGSKQLGDASSQEDSDADVSEFEDALSTATASARQAASDAAANDQTVRATARELARAPGSPSERGRGGLSAGRPSGVLPKRGVDRPPFADERMAAQRFAQEMQKARISSRHTISKRTPGGRLNMRRVVRGVAERQAGLPPRSTPWDVEIDRHRRLLDPHAVLAIDISSSMDEYEEYLGPIAWQTSEGYRLTGGRLAVSVFGDSAGLLHDGRRAMRLVPAIKVYGGTAYAGDAIVMACNQLDMENRLRPRAIYCVSDGIWSDTRDSVAQIRHLRSLGVPTLHIAILQEPLSVEADATIVVANPQEAMRVIAAHSVELLNAQSRGRGRKLATAT